MKITFVSPPPNLSGGLRVVSIYADALRARGHDVQVVATSWQGPSPKERLKDLAQGRFGTTKLGSHYDTMKAPLILLDHAGPVTDADLPDADVVIATWWETAFAVVRLSPAKGRGFYFVQGHEVHDYLPNHLSGGSYYLPLKKITISSWLKDTMRAVYNDSDVALVPNSVDLSVFHAPERMRQKVPTIGVMYAPQSFKGLDTSFAVIEQARLSYPDLRVISFGMNPPEKDLPLPKNTRYIQSPRGEALREIYASCDVFLTSSRIEGFGLPILEAMACRTPVVATRTGCASDVIRDEVNGHIANVDDIEALSDGITRILDLDDTGWQEMSNAALNTVSSYTWDDAATRFEQALSPQ